MIKAYTDGACRISNPGLCSCAWVVYGLPSGTRSAGIYLGHAFHTNNFAEYMGLVSLLTYLYEGNIRNVQIYSDSNLVVNQVNQEWVINDSEYRKMAAKAYGLLNHGGHTLQHIKGHDGDEGNELADKICNEVLDQHMEEYENYIAAKN